MNGKVTDFTHPAETVDDASQTDFNPFVPQRTQVSNRQTGQEAGFWRFLGLSKFSACFTPSPTRPHARQGDSGVGPLGSGRHLLTASRAGRAEDRRGRPRTPALRARHPPGSGGPRGLRPRPVRHSTAASALAAGVARPGRRLHPRRSRGRVGLPRGPPDTHRPARPNRGPGPGCRARRARLLRAAPAPLRAPHRPWGPPPRRPSAPPGSRLFSSPAAPRPPPQAAALLVRPAPLRFAPPTRPGLASQAVAVATAANLPETRTLRRAGTRTLSSASTRTPPPAPRPRHS